MINRRHKILNEIIHTNYQFTLNMIILKTRHIGIVTKQLIVVGLKFQF